jgi:hypothetical protein
MKIACYTENIPSPGPGIDQWVTSKCEGRLTINAGFGFGELGHEVDIVGLCPQKNVFQKISNKPLENRIAFVKSWNE